jgi:hypothetical protein
LEGERPRDGTTWQQVIPADTCPKQIRVEIQDSAGKALPGFAAADCVELLGNRLAMPVRWKQGGDLSALAGKPIRLRFVMKDADLYALQFILQGTGSNTPIH